jgi:spermidine/putrescine transport system substrate-binding protein
MKLLALFVSVLVIVAMRLDATDSPGMLRVLAFDRSIPRELSLEFTDRTGIPVDITTAISSMEAADFLYRKKQSFDLLLVSNDVLASMHERGMLKSVDQRKIPNFARVKHQWRQAANDPKGIHRIPFDIASMGILVVKGVPQPQVRGYMDAFRKPRPGGVAVMVDQRDFLAAALLSLGASVNELSADNLRAARVILTNWLRNTAADSKKIWSNGHSPAFNALRTALVEERHAAALVYSGDAVALMSELPGRFEWINPVEGSLKYMTLCAIPKSSARPEAAHKFINFILDPAIAAQIVVAPGFGIPLNTPWTKMPLNFHGNPANMEAGELMDHFSVQADITREPRRELEEFFRSLPDPSAPPAP